MNKGTIIKIIAVIIAVIYTVLPVDIIPDVIPVIGWLDDLGIDVTALIIAFLKFSFTNSNDSITDSNEKINHKEESDIATNTKEEQKIIQRLEDMDNF